MTDTSKHIWIEGSLYFYMGFASEALTYLATEESYKYIHPGVRFWCIVILGSTLGGFNAVKAFRSMTFGRAYNQPDENTNVDVVIPQPPESVLPPVVVKPATTDSTIKK